MATKLLVIGIDALDGLQLAKYRPHLPAFSHLEQVCPAVQLSSVHPPDSDTAWATIYTGLSPAQHGIVKYEDPLEKSNRLASQAADNSILQGRTFWDLASQAGKKVCVLFPHLGYPVWPVNGIMIGRSGFTSVPATYPDTLKTRFDLRKLNVVKGFPGRDQAGYVRKNRELLLQQQRLAASMLEEQDWDLFFIYTSVLDMIQHYFWSLCDPQDPAYPGPNPHEDVIREFYQLHDGLVASLIEAAGPQAVTVILSDHGHGMRPQQVLNLNEFLLQKGWLALKDAGGRRKAAIQTMSQGRNFLLDSINRYHLEGLASALLRWLPGVRTLFSRPLSIDWDQTRAFGTNLSGVKAYSYGGIRIQRQGMSEVEYQALRSTIAREMAALTIPGSKTRLVRWITPRESLYQGPYLSAYPDLLFELEQGWGAGLTTPGSLFGAAPSRNLVPGSHRGEGAVFLLHNHPGALRHANAQLMDIAPTLCTLLGIAPPQGSSGSSLV